MEGTYLVEQKRISKLRAEAVVAEGPAAADGLAVTSQEENRPHCDE